MKAIILAAGLGKRLRPLTNDKPKCLVEVAGKPIIDHIIDGLNVHGIKDILINTHYMPEKVVQHVGDHAIYSYEPKLLGHFGTIKSLKEWVINDDYFMVINGDTIGNVNYTEMIESRKPLSVNIALDEWRSVGVWIYSTATFTADELPIYAYRQKNLVWYDCGTIERLRAANEFYGKSYTSMSEL